MRCSSLDASRWRCARSFDTLIAVRTVIVVVCLAIAPRLALANWTYKWWYTGNACAGNQLGVEGFGGSFPDRSSCEAARASDPHNSLATQSGCLANVDSCIEGDPSSSSSYRNGHRVAGIMRFYGGVPVGAISNASLVASEGGGFGGVQVARGGFPGHHLYFFAGFFGAETDIKDETGKTSSLEHMGLDLGAELQLGDGRVTGIIQFGSGLMGAKLDDVGDGPAVKGMAGIDIGLTERTAVFLYGAGIATWSLPGAMFAGVALEFRSQQLVDNRS